MPGLSQTKPFNSQVATQQFRQPTPSKLTRPSIQTSRCLKKIQACAQPNHPRAFDPINNPRHAAHTELRLLTSQAIWKENLAQLAMGRAMQLYGIAAQEKDFANIKNEIFALSQEFIKSAGYPLYFYAPIHGDEQGYLTPKSVFTTEPAMMFLAKIGLDFPELKDKSPEECRQFLCDQFMQKTLKYAAIAKHQLERVMDIGSGTGRTARRWSLHLPKAQIVAVEPSPFCAGFIKHHKAAHPEKYQNIKFIPEFGETVQLDKESVDICSMAFVAHELPTSVLLQMLNNLQHAIKPGGLISILDDAPDSPAGKVMLNAPDYLRDKIADMAFEPFIREYFENYVQVANFLKEIGFEIYTETVGRYQILIARKPQLPALWLPNSKP